MSLELTQMWSTPIGEDHIEMSTHMRQVLTRLMEEQDSVDTADTYNAETTDLKKFEKKVYNLFDYSRYGDDPFNLMVVDYLREFEKKIAKIIREYILKAWNVDNADIKVRAFGNAEQTYSRRIPPHFHHGWDGVTVTYLTVGEEFKPKGPSREWSGQTPEPMNTEFSGNLIMQDPRPAISFPYIDKAKTFKPKTGMTIIHPGYVWHETETHTHGGVRSCLVVDFKILSRNCDVLPTPLIDAEV